MDARGRSEIAETTGVGPTTKRMLCRLDEHAQSCPTLPGGCQAARLLCLWEPRQEYWIGLSFPPPGDLLNPGIEPGSPASAGGFFITEPPGKLLDWAFLLKSKICQILLKNYNNFLKWELPGSPVVKGLPWWLRW